MKYDGIRGDLRTGDIVLFSGKGFLSWLIKQATRSQWSHVGLVLVLPEFDFVTLWESTTLSNIPDLFTRKPTHGVQLVPLRQRLATYTGGISIRHLFRPLNEAETELALGVRRKLQGRPYERKTWQLIRAALDWRWSASGRDLSSVFCSEAVAEFLQAAGRIPAAIASSEWTPADLAIVAGWTDPVPIS